jgi:hypothetical protein
MLAHGNLLGLGRKLNQQWDLVFSGDVLGDKSRIDIEMELSHRDGTGNHARFVVVAPDYPFNDKQDEARFTRQHYASQRFVGKVGLPLEWRISEATGASAVINPTFYLHRAAFGGGNVQMRIPF